MKKDHQSFKQQDLIGDETPRAKMRGQRKRVRMEVSKVCDVENKVGMYTVPSSGFVYSLQKVVGLELFSIRKIRFRYIYINFGFADNPRLGIHHSTERQFSRSYSRASTSRNILNS